MSIGQNVMIQGVFSTMQAASVGTGTTTKRTTQKMFWFVAELANKTLEVQPLNESEVPSGLKTIVTMEEFLNKYEPEPEYYLEVVLPRMKELDTTIARGELHRDRSELYSAEYEFSSAIEIDEHNVRANFGLGLTYLARGETDRASDIFKRLVVLDSTFEPQHKHLFNEFGISLRKNGMIDQALDYYHKAEKISKRDDNLCLNIARAYFENGKVQECLNYVHKSLDINPEHEEAGRFLKYMKNIGCGEDDIIMVDDEAAPTAHVKAKIISAKKEKKKSDVVVDMKFNF
ncbi:tetratricopeptide repeat protein [Maridesulfovibrio frigidus]|uniref:tetratricopeptide repeat protein n=1 Tax=Maridesulfovibrio frigidus TaxID=340956 RepID=UPI000555467F|nr:tetratricopeptide repeat protein [Maridesulfovibrio frigidus]